jgi:hypothetical protein
MTPRAAFIKNADLKRLAAYAWDAMQLASTHDPDLAKSIKQLEAFNRGYWLRHDELISRIEILGRQVERLGAPQYRIVRKVKGLHK